MKAALADLGSQLVFREIVDGRHPQNGAVVLLHDVNGSLDDLVPLGRSLELPLRIYAPQAIDALCVGRHTTGHTWFHSVAPDMISPTSFRTNLCHLIEFLQDRKNEIGDLPIFVVGVGQGAVMGLTVATTRPDLVAGAVSIDGFLSGMDVRDIGSSTNGTPILLIENAAGRADHALAASSAQRLRAMGAAVAVRRAGSGASSASAAGLADLISPWMSGLMN